MNKIIIYIHTNLINGKVYIGQTKRSLNTRSGKDGNGYSGSPHFYHAIKQYGWENFKHEILKEVYTQEEADFYEKFYIEQYDSTNQNKGYNILIGGKDCYDQIVPHNFKKGQKSNRNKPVICIETQQIFRSMADASRWCGSLHVIDCCRGKRDHAGRHPEIGIQLSWKYYKNDLKNIDFLECEEKNITHDLNIGKTKKVMCINNGKVFNSLGEASLWYSGTDGNRSCISRVCKGERQSAGKDPVTGEKLKWKFIEED